MRNRILDGLVHVGSRCRLSTATRKIGPTPWPDHGPGPVLFFEIDYFPVLVRIPSVSSWDQRALALHLPIGPMA